MKRVLDIKSGRGFMHMAGGIVYKNAPDWYGGDNMTLRMNIIRRPWEGPRPTIVWLTGGAWQQSTFNVHVPELVYLVEAGFTVASVEYRTSEDAVFPAQIEDVKAAIRYLRANAARWCVDPDHIGIMGESAGGHLSALAGTTSDIRDFDVGENLDMSSAVQCVCDWYGPADFSTFKLLSNERSPEAIMIGGMKEQIPDKYKAASPVTYINKNTPPFLIIHGNADSTVDISQSDELYDKLTAAGVDCDYVVLNGAIHGDLRFVTPEVKAIIKEFFEKNLM